MPLNDRSKQPSPLIELISRILEFWLMEIPVMLIVMAMIFWPVTLAAVVVVMSIWKRQ
jgi:hypothetical protein